MDLEKKFFKYNDIDLICDNSSFSANFNKIVVGVDNFFWGYNDKDLFNQSFSIIDSLKQDKRLDIYFTGTSHSPYIINDESYYSNKLKELTPNPYQEFYTTYSKYLKSILFVDDALNQFLTNYKKRDDYENTIFIITGDHPMTELPIANSLKRYHVPLLIYSEKLNTSEIFSHTVSHLDISETVLSFLQNYTTNIPSISTSLGSQLLPQDEEQIKNIAFMNDNREVIDFLSGDYFLSNDNLYHIDSSINISPVKEDSIKSLMIKKLNTFNNTSRFVSQKNKIISSTLYCKELNHQNIYNYNSSDTIRTSSEYYTLVNKTIVPDTDFIYDISLNVSSNLKDEVFIVYQITNSNDSTLLWENIGMDAEDGMIQAHIPIKNIQTNNTLYFKSYIWNKNKNNVIVSDLDILLHAPIPTIKLN